MTETHTETGVRRAPAELEQAKELYARMTADERREFVVWMLAGCPAPRQQAAGSGDSRSGTHPGT